MMMASSSLSGGGPNTNEASRRPPLRETTAFPTLSHDRNLDRFIPNRATIDWDYANYMLLESSTEPPVVNQNYRNQLALLFKMTKSRRILRFNSKPPPSILHSPPKVEPPAPKPPRVVPLTPHTTLCADGLVHDYYLNLLDWGPALAVALSNSVYLWTEESISELLTVSDDIGPVTSLSWSPDGRCIAVALNNSEVQLWDPAANRKTATLQGAHTALVGSLAWNDSHILTTGGVDALIANNDIRIRDHVVQRYQGHREEICGLKWSDSGQQLASGGGDSLVHVWDQSAASSNSPARWLHRFRDHTAAVKALAWCPFQKNLLASGGGVDDCHIRFWNTQTGSCLNSVDTGSQISGLLWNPNERELLSSHGFSQQSLLRLWKYPSMTKRAELTGHTSGILHMTQSPNRCTVATAAIDDTLRLWNVFGDPELAAKPKSKIKPEPFARVSRIR